MQPCVRLPLPVPVGVPAVRVARWVPAVLVLAVLLASAATPPAASAQQPSPLLRDLYALAHDSMGGRAVGTPGNAAARAYIVERFREAGLEPRLDSFVVARGGDTVPGVNVFATVGGTEHPDRYIVVSAHYDHLGTRDGEVFNGADDNASGTAAILELARRFAARPGAHSLIFVAFDAEEGGLRGARHFVEDPPVAREAMVLNVNLDMVSRSESELYVSGTYQYPRLLPFIENARPAEPVVLRTGHDTPADAGADNWVGASDHGAFHQAGTPFLYFGVEDHPDYHRPTDDPEKVDPAFFEAAVETIRRVILDLDRGLAGG